MSNDYDVVIVGAGISGISAAYHLRKSMPHKRICILEGREAIGGTWDLFRYPGIRSDSDMYTLGFQFRPWTHPKAIADAPAILEYLNETADVFDLRKLIQFQTKVTQARWNSGRSAWTLNVQRNGNDEKVTTQFLFLCTGYYNYEAGYRPEFKDEKKFAGQIVHPQHWPENLNYDGKKVAVIGSGATAITIVPEMAKRAERVTMVQRSPTYIVAMPGESKFAHFMHRNLPDMVAYRLVRLVKILLQRFSFWYCRTFPEKAKQKIIEGAREALGPGFEVDKHFTPPYNPWEQRMCLAPDGDFFQALKSGKADVVTDHIEGFDKKGIRLVSGEHVDADIIVTATGLNLQFLGGMDIYVDRKKIKAHDTYNYKGLMFSGIPNLAQSFGYTNASWTLKCDLTSAYVCRLIAHMDKHNYTAACPQVDAGSVDEEPLLDFSSGYVQRALTELPKQGSVRPWKLHQNYLLDLAMLGYGSVDDEAISFSRS